MAEAKRLILVDGSAYIFRAFFALKPMNRSDGTPVNAVFGFTKMLMKLMKDEVPDYAIVVFDVARKTFRNEIYPEYKANRDDPPDELIPQFSLIRDATRALNLPVAEMENYEADDLIATYARLGREQGMDVVIVSSDKDLMQLVGGGVEMLDPMKQKRIGVPEVKERFDVAPDKVVEVQALAGDSTDNVPGVPGIGVKTAAELINTYGSMEELLKRAEEIKQPKRRESLIEHAELARVSMRLVTLCDTSPLPVALEDCEARDIDVETLGDFLKAQEFKSLLAGLDNLSATEKKQPSKPPIEGEYALIDDAAQLKQWVSEAIEAGVVAIDTETTSLTASLADLVGISLAVAPGRACYIPLRHKARGAPKEQGGFEFGDEQEPATNEENEEISPIKQIDFSEAIEILRPLLSDESVLKIGHNLKYDAHVLMRPINGEVRVSPVDDTMCLSYVLDAGRQSSHKLDELAEVHLAHSMIKYEDICGKGASQIGFAEVAPEEALAYAAEDADYTLRLWQHLKPRLTQEKKARVYERLERPLISIIAEMETEGIKVDSVSLAKMSEDFASRLKVLEKEIYKLADEEFNIASPKQLGDILFGKLGFEGSKKSKTGAWSTSVDILEDLALGGAEIATKVLEWRHLAKLKSTYADALQASIHPKSKRVHTSFSMVGASTGRLSSSDPNLQNIPIRTEEGRQIRTAFVAESGAVLISADYSQIELRLVAHIAAEKRMIEAFDSGIDIHAQTASEVFSIPLDAMTPETRRRAKAINFGIIYGISGFGLGRQLGIPQSEARQYIDAYFERFPGIRNYMQAMKTQAKEEGFVETLFGRRVYIAGIKASNPAHRGFAERQAINAPIQGTAADIIKQAMVRMPGALKEAKSPARMLLQVHDELVFECPKDASSDALAIIKEVMENAAKPTLSLSVPLVVDTATGASWNDIH